MNIFQVWGSQELLRLFSALYLAYLEILTSLFKPKSESKNFLEMLLLGTTCSFSAYRLECFGTLQLLSYKYAPDVCEKKKSANQSN